MEDEAIDTVFQSIPSMDSLLEHPRESYMEFMRALTTRSTLVNILFSGSRQSVLMAKLEPKIKAAIFSKHPEYQNDLGNEILLTLLIQGSAYAFTMYQSQGPDKVLEYLGAISECLITGMMNRRQPG